MQIWPNSHNILARSICPVKFLQKFFFCQNLATLELFHGYLARFLQDPCFFWTRVYSSKMRFCSFREMKSKPIRLTFDLCSSDALCTESDTVAVTSPATTAALSGLEPGCTYSVSFQSACGGSNSADAPTKTFCTCKSTSTQSTHCCILGLECKKV